jgi:hypothetical protein
LIFASRSALAAMKAGLLSPYRTSFSKQKRASLEDHYFISGGMNRQQRHLGKIFEQIFQATRSACDAFVGRAKKSLANLENAKEQFLPEQ